MSKRNKQRKKLRKMTDKHSLPEDNAIEGSVTYSNVQDNRKHVYKPSKSDVKKFVSMVEDKSGLKTVINKLIDEITTILRTNNPIDILFAFCLNFNIGTREYPGKYEQSAGVTYYISNLALAYEYPDNTKETKELSAIYDELVSKYIELEKYVHFYYMPGKEHKDDVEKQLIYRIKTYSLGVFAKSHWAVSKIYFKEFADDVDEVFSKELNFSLTDLLNFLEKIEQDRVGFLNEQMEFQRVMSEEHELFKKFIKKRSINSDDPDVVLSSFLNSLSDSMKENHEKAAKQYRAFVDRKNLFEIVPENKTEQEILSKLSRKFGQNAQFLSRYSDQPAWPIRTIEILKKPFVAHDKKYYLFLLSEIYGDFDVLFTGVVDMLCDKSKNVVLKKRDKFLEKKAAVSLETIYGKKSVFRNLHFRYIYQDKEIVGETDVIVRFGNALIIVDAKAGKFHDEARSGRFDKLDTDLKKLVKAPYEQSLKVKNYIQRVETPVFTEKPSGKSVLSLNCTDIDYILLLNITLEPIFPIQASTKDLINLGLFRDDDLALSLSVFDFMILIEMLDSPSLFLHYLDKRISITSKFKNLELGDEMNILGLFLDNKIHDLNQMAKDCDTFSLDSTNIDIIKYTAVQNRTGFDLSPAL